VRAALVILAACSSSSASSPSVAMARDQYVGPDACGECHAEQHAAWSRSLHRVMNARADAPGAVIGDFRGAVVRYAGGEARFERRDGVYTMTLVRGGTSVRYRVTRTIGRRGLQEYVGVADDSGDEVRLPFGWWPRRGGWYPQPYFDPWLDETKLDVYAKVTEPWAERCPWCHSTYPFALRVERARALHVGHGLEQRFVDDAPAVPTRAALDVEQQVSVGISCESCHLGGRAHADGAAMRFVPGGAKSFADERRDPEIVDAVCAQCHSGPSPRLPDGTALRNSSEALDLAASPCRAARCTDCHDPHRADARADTARAIAACVGCHRALADPATARAHTGHAAATCLDCHMPRVVMGIDRFVRTHRISSPTDRRVLAIAAPNACNLCHLDRSIAWTVDALERGWSVRVDVPERAYGDLDRDVGEVWLASARPAFRIVAADAYARAFGRRAIAKLLPGLADPIAYIRTWTLFAIEDALGRRVRDDEYDPRSPRLDKLRAQLAK
jgi:predicted CXXCH cytochrome family protein